MRLVMQIAVDQPAVDAAEIDPRRFPEEALHRFLLLVMFGAGTMHAVTLARGGHVMEVE